MLFKHFILKTSILVFITSVLCFFLFKFLYPDKLLLIYLFLPILFGFINVLIFYSLLQVKDATLIRFSNRYLLCTTVKLFFSMALVVLFLLFNKEKALPFLFTFLGVYLVFLVQEIISILKIFKKKEKSETTHAKS